MKSEFSLSYSDLHADPNGTASVVYWSEFLATDPGVPGSIPGTTKKKELWVWNGVHSAS
jgi:hypothetical protein